MDRPARILVVDSSRMGRNALSQVLHSQLHNVELVCCGSAGEALQRLQEGQGFDMVTTSLVLADMDGMELVTRLHQMSRGAGIPVVVVSGQAEDRERELGKLPGVSDYFDKSDGYRALVDFMRDFVERNFVEGRILFVEDDMVAGTLTQRLLERHGFEVVHTTSAEQAAALLEQTRGCEKSGQRPFFDLVLSDFFLKDSGTAATLLHTIRVKLHYSSQELPVLVVTASNDSQRQIEAFRAGANDFVTKPFLEEIFISRVRSLLLLNKQYNVMQRQAEEMQRIAVTDALTGVHNRRFLNEYGDRFLTREGNQPVSVVFVEVDDLARINKEDGQLTGDRVLKEVAELFGDVLGNDTTVARFAGKEFCCLLPRASRQRAYQLAESLRKATEVAQPGGVEVTLSIGVANTVDFPDADLNTLIGKADTALMRAKNEGGNFVCVELRTV